jgi:hypothetical protein
MTNGFYSREKLQVMADFQLACVECLRRSLAQLGFGNWEFPWT